MISLSTWLAVALASVAIVIVPGPTVTVIIANSLRHGARAGLLNVAGTQLGIALMVLVLAFGLSAVVTFLGSAFFWLKLAGAAYLVWLGIRLWRSDGTLGAANGGRRPAGSFFWQGFIVIWSNPKALFFFGAFLPQFIDPAGNAILQTMLLGGTHLHPHSHHPGRLLRTACRRHRSAFVAPQCAACGDVLRHLPDRRRAVAGPDPAAMKRRGLPPALPAAGKPDKAPA